MFYCGRQLACAVGSIPYSAAFLCYYFGDTAARRDDTWDPFTERFCWCDTEVFDGTTDVGG